MTAHTPGPWRVKGKARNLILRIFAGDHDDIDTEIATVFRSGPVDYEANARLIAAAPELLAALKALVDVLNDDLDSEQCAAWDAAVAAIDNAEGGRSTDNGAPVQPEGLV